MPVVTAPAKVKAKRAQLQPMFLARVDLYENPAHGPAKTLYLCDGLLARAGYQALGQHWTPCVKSWGTLQAALGSTSVSDLGGGPTTAEIILFNNKRVGGKRRFTDILQTVFNFSAGTYELLGSKVTIYWLFAGLDNPDQVLVHEFYVDDFRDADVTTLRLRMSTIDAAIDKRQQVTTIDVEHFPLSDLDARGHTIPTVFGLMQNVPALAIVAPGLTYVTVGTQFSGVPVIVGVVSTKSFPQAGTFLAIFHDVTMTMKVLNETQLQMINASANFTLPTGHPILEKRTGAKAVRYAVAQNRYLFDTDTWLLHGALSNVRAGKIPKVSGVTFDLNDTTFGPSLAIINFDVSPARLTQVSQQLAPLTQTSPMTFIRPSVNLPITIIAAPKTIASPTTTVASAVVRVSTVPVPGTISAVRRSIRFKITSSPDKVTSWKITRSTPAVTNLFAGTTTIPVGDVKTAEWTSAKTYGPETITLTVVCPANTTGVFRIDIDFFQERVDSDVLTPSTSDNSLADVVVGDVSCDVEGLHDDALGTITATPNALIQRPADCVKSILTTCYGVPLASIGASFAATRASQAADGLLWAFIFDAIRFADLRRKAGEQGRAILYQDAGKFEYQYLPYSFDAIAQMELDYKKDLWGKGPRAPLSRTPRTEVVTVLTSYAQIDIRKGSGKEAFGYSKTTIQGLGDLTGSLFLDWIQDQPTADSIHGFWQFMKAKQHWQTEFVTYPKVLELKGVAYIAIKNHPLLAVHGDNALVWRIQNRDYQMADANPAHIRLQLIEA